MNQKIFLIPMLLLSQFLLAQEGALKINVTDSLLNSPLEMAGVALQNKGQLVRNAMTDSNGVVFIKNLSPGVYDVSAAYAGFSKKIMTGVVVANSETTYITVELSSEVLTSVIITEWEEDLMPPTTSIKTIHTYNEMKHSPYRGDILQLATLAPGAVQVAEGDTPNFRGARKDGVVYYIDGMRVIGSFDLPKAAIGQMSVMTGGIPAKYGDGTGAFIEIETRSGLVKY